MTQTARVQLLFLAHTAAKFVKAIFTLGVGKGKTRRDQARLVDIASQRLLLPPPPLQQHHQLHPILQATQLLLPPPGSVAVGLLPAQDPRRRSNALLLLQPMAMTTTHLKLSLRQFLEKMQRNYQPSLPPPTCFPSHPTPSTTDIWLTLCSSSTPNPTSPRRPYSTQGLLPPFVPSMLFSGSRHVRTVSPQLTTTTRSSSSQRELGHRLWSRPRRLFLSA